MVGLDASDALFDTAEETGGSKDAITVSHTHTATSVVTDPQHNHTIGTRSSLTGNFQGFQAPEHGSGNDGTVTTSSVSTGITVATTNASTGSSGTNANVQPFIVVRMWKRTA
jgi:hypothetical protein